MNLQIQPALPAEAPLLKELLGDYLDELSAFEIGTGHREDAPSYQHLPLYWTEADRYPFLILLDGDVAGFALVCREPPDLKIEWRLAEFCVLSQYRERRVGFEAAKRLVHRFPGRWELEVLVANEPAIAFWRKCLDRSGFQDVQTEAILKEDGPRLLHRFTVREAS